MATTGSGLAVEAVDPVRTFTQEEQQQLTDNLARLIRAIGCKDYSDRIVNDAFLCEIHRRIFIGVRDHAGQLRRPGFGSEWLEFGPHRSIHRDQVRAELAKIFDATAKSVRSFRDYPNDEDYEEKAIKLAVWAHAEVIRVHPFEDSGIRGSIVWGQTGGRAGPEWAEPFLATVELLPEHTTIRSYTLRFGDAENGLGQFPYNPRRIFTEPALPGDWLFVFHNS